MLLIESFCGESELSVADPLEVTDASFRKVYLQRRHIRPQCRCYEVGFFIEVNHGVIVSLYIWPDIQSPVFVQLVDVKEFV